MSAYLFYLNAAAVGLFCNPNPQRHQCILLLFVSMKSTVLPFQLSAPFLLCSAHHNSVVSLCIFCSVVCALWAMCSRFDLTYSLCKIVVFALGRHIKSVHTQHAAVLWLLLRHFSCKKRGPQHLCTYSCPNLLEAETERNLKTVCR